MDNEAENQQPRRPQEQNRRRQSPSYNDFRQTIRTVKTVVRIARLALNPAVIWALVGIFIAIIIYMLFFSGAGALPFGGGGNSSQQNPSTGTVSPKNPPIPGLTLTLTGPDAVDNGVNIEYMASVSYDKTLATTPIENITVYLDIPVNSSFVRASGNNTQNGNTISWPLSDPQNQSSFTFVLNPTANDITLPVRVYAKTKIGGRGSAGGFSPQAFRDLIAGQGRNTAVLGDKASFMSTIIANSSGLPLAGKEGYLSQIYDAGIHYNVNPLILVVIWGVESTFDTSSNLPFGCFEVTGLIGFSENVTCAGGTIDMHMKTFETNGGVSLEISSTTGNTCIYADAFDYAYEKYTPVCSTSDGNDPARANFISIYTKLKGI